jgi:SAM-dependent methyltransferase
MKTQKEIWQDEHIKQETFTRMHEEKPSSPIQDLITFLKEKGYVPEETNVLDIGCGKGRNTRFLASEGFMVTGADFAPKAIQEAREKSKNFGQKVVFDEVDLSEKWPYPEESFDIIIDCNTTICIPIPGREVAVAEAKRVLKPEGYYLFYGVARTDFADTNPGLEPNSAIFPRTGKFEKQYTQKELLDTYRDFECVNLKRIEGRDIIEGENIIYSMWVVYFRK